MTTDILALFHIVTLAAGFAAIVLVVILLVSRPKPKTPGFHWVIPIFGNELHIKHRRMPRWVEDKQVVPVFRFGRTLVSYWSRSTIRNEERYID